MTTEQWVGLILWVLIFYPAWSPRCRRARATKRESATPSTVRTKSTSRQTGPMWEQDKPFPECFDAEIGDDL